MIEVEEPSREVTSPAAKQEVRVAIIGAGFSGLGMAINLKREGEEDFVLLERADDLGGTWRANTYPGCACDIPSHLYSFSFAPNPDWSQTYSPQPEIWDYLRRTADEFEITPHVRYGHDVVSAEWDEDAERWRIETAGGSFVAEVLVAAPGPLSEPVIPEVPGLESFEGTIFHSAEWNHEHDLAGKRVAVIGTGASAIQFVPEIQPDVGRMHLFQRTPPWLLPHPGRGITRPERRLFRRLPALQRLVRAVSYSWRELLVVGFTMNHRLMRPIERLARRHMEKHVTDPEMRKRLTPDYRIGCKRILQSDTFYPAITQPNVELVTDSIREVRASSVITEDGTEREVDTVIFGTGFRAMEMPVAERIRGRDGLLLGDEWRTTVQAYLGTAVAGFPNFFVLIGPNTGLGHNSMVYMIESQVAYVLDALRAMKERSVGSLEVRSEVQDTYNRQVQRRMEPTVWTSGGCSSWYLDPSGRNATLWPSFTFKFRRRTRRFDPSSFRLRPRSPAPS